MTHEHYVYALFREDGQTPFYIGMGKGNRITQHQKKAKKNRSYKDHIILKMIASGISEIPHEKLVYGLSHAEAIEIECMLIQLIGRHPIGPLANISGGREGILNLSHECLEARRIAVAAAQRRPEVRALHSKLSKGRKCPKSQETREKIRASLMGFKHTPEAKEKIRLAGIGRKQSQETIAKRLKTRGSVTLQPHSRAAISAKLKGRKLPAKTIEKMRIAHAARRSQSKT